MMVGTTLLMPLRSTFRCAALTLSLALLGCGDNHHEPIVTFSDASPPDAMGQGQ